MGQKIGSSCSKKLFGDHLLHHLNMIDGLMTMIGHPLLKSQSTLIDDVLSRIIITHE
jgi:hypothetical protein